MLIPSIPLIVSTGPIHEALWRVERPKWVRGEVNGSSQLLNDLDCRCCLGFVGQQCGVPDEQLRGIGRPDITASVHMFPPWLRNSYDESKNPMSMWPAIVTNDKSDIAGEEREAELQDVFHRHNEEIVFVG